MIFLISLSYWKKGAWEYRKTTEQIELLQLDKSGIKVAEYMTELPKRELLEQKLHKAVELARKRLEIKPANGNTGDG
jgi:lipopolysaccharide biosynthesis regulator YciM